MFRLKELTLLLLLFVLASCTKTPDKVVSISPTSFSVEDQIKIGTTFKGAILSNPDMFNVLSENDYPEAYEYVSAVFQSLLFTSQVTRRNTFDWTLSILNDDEIKTAFFLPGGHFYITTGLLKYIDTESQLFSIMGHEIFYVETDAMVIAMKDEFGSTTMGDVLLNNPLENINEMAEEMPRLILKEKQVMDADEYVIDLICPFQYDATSLNAFIYKALECPQSERPLWLYAREGNPQERLQMMAGYASPCGMEGITNIEDYVKFKENHLP